ncbi:MAG: 4-hydroxy-tetrahydrodipicolinate reductase [Vampirovibrionales bacterium]|nr:4-hydroxy-tetrahydrodipicolinate reductase [Vampirovibrionales bacterium]
MSGIRVAVCGALGRMGLEVVKTVLADPELELVAAIEHHRIGETLHEASAGVACCELVLEEDLGKALVDSQAQVCVDFTHPSTVFQNALTIIEAGCRPVIGTTGISSEQLEKIKAALEAKNIGGLVAPNFAIGAVLIMKFAQEAAKYFDHAEIIEFHHNQKADAPSGTAIKTAEMMAETLGKFNPSNAPEKELYEGARGARKTPGDIPIHSVRLPGYVAHQEILFGCQGQTITLRHDSIDRASFMPGVAMGCKKIMSETGLVYGLEHLI